jgi:hypothetical protein
VKEGEILATFAELEVNVVVTDGPVSQVRTLNCDNNSHMMNLD